MCEMPLDSWLLSLETIDGWIIEEAGCRKQFLVASAKKHAFQEEKKPCALTWPQVREKEKCICMENPVRIAS